jgi:hypothetical protein
VEFDIFPDLVSKSKLQTVFINFIEDFDSLHVLPGDQSFRLNFEKFIGVVIYIAIGAKLGEEVDAFKRILYFIQKMIQSKGLGSLTKKTGSAKYYKIL